ncbi:Histone transcription regulator 3 [Haplosporangium sp. Z 11]|nr:Histone transcription regulator 3 [Haplosporangium sp. Z 11]
MIRFAVLNEEEQPKSKEEESVEIQAEKCLGIYESAIRLLQRGKHEESKRLFKNLVESDLLQKIDNDSEIAARGTPLRRLQYLVYANYASILEQAADETRESVLHYYLRAIAFDNSDNSLWIKVGTLAAEAKKFKLARYALECGLQQPASDESEHSMEDNVVLGAWSDRDLTPSQWACLETLCEVLYEIGDFEACEDYVQKALRISPYFARGIQLQNLIRSRSQGAQNQDIFDRKPLIAASPPEKNNGKPKELLLEDPSWLGLGELLLAEYKSLLEAPETEFYNQRLVVRTQQSQNEDIEMREAPLNEEISCAPETEAAMDSNAQSEDTAQKDSSLPDSSDASALPAVASDEAAEQADKEVTESEQNAAMKRKRKEVEERSGLRTSKRVRDKLDQFEVTKKKREEEEQETLAKYRIVLSKFGMDLERGYFAGPKPDALESVEIFPNGLSGLLSMFNMHLERPNALVQASTMDQIQQQKTNHFAIFTLEKTELPTEPIFEDRATLLEFINRANERNSGIAEYLCEFVLLLISGLTKPEDVSNWQRSWPKGLRPIVSDIVTMIGDQILEYLHQESRLDESIYELQERIKLELQLSMCEMYLDELIHTILLPFTLVSRKSRGSKKVDVEQLARLEKQFQRWLYLAGLGLEFPLASLRNGKDFSKAESWIQAVALRFNWMLGRYAQYQGNAMEAISRFDGCLQILSSNPALSATLSNCKYDIYVDTARIQERLGRLKTHQYVLDAERLFSEKDFGAVLTRLEPIFLDANTTHTPMPTSDDEDEAADSSLLNSIGGSLPERLGLMGLLYKSCDALQYRTRQFRCVTRMFIVLVENLVNMTTDKSDATEIWFLFSQISQTLFLMRDTLQSSSLSELLSALDYRELQKLVCCVLAIVRLGFVNVLHQDRLVDDGIKVSCSDLLKNRPHLEQFNLVLVRVWVVLLLLLPGWIQENTNSSEAEAEADAADTMDHTAPKPISLVAQPLEMQVLELDAETVRRVLSQPLTTNSKTALGLYTCPSQELYMELIALVHDDLGVREICGIDNTLKISSPMQGGFYRKEENQCYYCFYGISLSVDGQYPIEHSSEPVDFDKKAAIEFFPLLERSLSNRVLRGQVRGDLKDAVDRVDEALGSPPYESYSILEMNRQLIDGLLASDIDFAEAIQVNSKNRLATMQQPPSSKLPSVYRRIYAIQGKIFLAQFRNKAKNNQFKPLEDLQKAIDQFRTDLHINPDSWDSWYALATCYASLADENLVFSASDIKNNFSKITDLQKRAFHCFSQAVRLAPKRIHRGNGDFPGAQVSDDRPVDANNAVHDEPMQDSEGSGRAISEDTGSEGGSDGMSESDTDQGTDHEWYQKQAAFWFDFGNLVHGIMSKPMRMEAMRRSGGRETISDCGDHVTIMIPEPTEEQVYKFAAFCFKTSLRLNDQNWRTSLMLGKCIEKLNGNPTQVLALYKRAADLVPVRSGQPGNERVFEAAYKLISTMSKYLFSDKIQPTAVESQMTKTFAKSKLCATDGESFIFEPPKEYLKSIEDDPPSETDVQKNKKLQAFRLLCEGLARIRYTDKRHWHHRPVYRQAWILYHVYHDVERAKVEMLSLFQIKSNLKTLVSSVWKPEFERSGKHFIYVGEYTKFLIVLAKETNDVETLNSLARKIRRAHGLLLDLKEIWELLYDSYLCVLGDLVGPDPVLAVAEVIPRTEFREKAAIYEAKMFEQEPRLPGLVVLQRLCELKKLNDKMAPEGQMGHLLAVCYSKLFIEVGGADLYPKELVRQLSGNMETSDTTAGSQTESYNATTGSGVQVIDAEMEDVTSTKRLQGGDGEDSQEDVRLKMSKLTTEAENTPDGSTSGTIPTVVIDDKDAVTNGQELTPDSSARGHGTNTPAIVHSSVTDAPSSPVPSGSGKDGESASGMDVEPHMGDWKSRKKISAAELASRATTMCKAPPPSLKAPQSLQSKLAGPSSTPTSEDMSASGPSADSGDTLMESAPARDEAGREGAQDDGEEVEKGNIPQEHGEEKVQQETADNDISRTGSDKEATVPENVNASAVENEKTAGEMEEKTVGEVEEKEAQGEGEERKENKSTS